MPLQIDGATVGEVRYARPDGSLATVGEARVWQGGQWRTIYTSIDTVVITDDGTIYGARDQFRAALTDYGLDYTTVTELPFRLDTSQVTNMRSMFTHCSALTSVPDLDTSQVTSMREMFRNCSSLAHVPDMDTSQVTDMRDMFNGCSALTDGNVRLIGKHPSVTTTLMISSSGLTRQPFYDTNGNPI